MKSVETIKKCPTPATVENMKQKTLTKARRDLAAYKFNPQQFDNWIDGGVPAFHIDTFSKFWIGFSHRIPGLMSYLHSF